MTKRNVTTPAEEAQTSSILDVFSDFLARSPGRSIVLSRRNPDRGGWLIEIVDRREAHGDSLRDASAQAATALAVESEEG